MAALNPAEINRLGKRFKKLDLDQSGTLTMDEFLAIPGLESNPLLERIIEVFDRDGNGEVDFLEFVQAISLLCSKGNRQSKTKFLFRVYDIDDDGYISNGELYQLLKIVSGNNVKDTDLQQIVDKTILYSDLDGDGKLNFEEFYNIVANAGETIGVIEV